MLSVTQSDRRHSAGEYSSWITAHASFTSSLAVHEQAALERASRRVSLRKRETVFSAGDPANKVFIVRSGCIRLYQLSSSGRITILWFNFPGELLGLAEAVQGGPREVFAEANIDSELLVITEANFMAFLQEFPQAAMRTIGILSSRLRTLGASLVDLASDDVSHRLVHVLLRFAASGPTLKCTEPLNQGEICLNIELTHSDLANLIGASRQTVSSLMAQFRRQGLLKLTGRHIHILDMEKLSHRLDT